MNVKKVCMVVHAYYPADETRVRREAEALVGNGWEVDVICLRDMDEKAFEVISKIKVIRLPVKRHQGSRIIIYMFEYLVFFFMAFVVLFFKFIKKQYEIIQVHNPPDFLIFTAFLPKLFGSKIILDIHDLTPELLFSKLTKDNLTIKISKIIERISFSFADFVIASAHEVPHILYGRRLPKGKIAVVTNVADPNLFRKLPNRQKQSKINGSRWTLLYHGALVKHYALETGIKAVALLKNQIPNIRFKIYGRGETLGELREKISKLNLDNYIDLAGFVPADTIPQVISEADVGIVPLKKDRYSDSGIPTRLYELILMDKPVICSRAKPVEDIFDSSAVMFFESEDENDLARCILELYRNPQKRAALVRNARKQYEPISWEVMSKRYVELVNALING